MTAPDARYFLRLPNGALLPYETEEEARKMYSARLVEAAESFDQDAAIDGLDYGKIVPTVNGADDPLMADDFIPKAVDIFTPPLNGLAHTIWNIARIKGFRSSRGDVPVATFVANLHGEVSELWEAYRAGALDANCGKPTAVPLTCAEEELADILIRTLDMAADLGVDIDKAIETKLKYNLTREHKHGKVC